MSPYTDEREDLDFWGSEAEIGYAAERAADAGREDIPITDLELDEPRKPEYEKAEKEPKRGAFEYEDYEYSQLRKGMGNPETEYEVYCSYHMYDRQSKEDTFEKVYDATRASELDAINYIKDHSWAVSDSEFYWTIKEVQKSESFDDKTPKDIPTVTFDAAHWHEEGRWLTADKGQEAVEAVHSKGTDYEVYRSEYNPSVGGYDQTHVATYSSEVDAFHYIRENSWQWDQDGVFLTVKEVERELDRSLESIPISELDADGNLIGREDEALEAAEPGREVNEPERDDLDIGD